MLSVTAEPAGMTRELTSTKVGAGLFIVAWIQMGFVPSRFSKISVSQFVYNVNNGAGTVRSTPNSLIEEAAPPPAAGRVSVALSSGKP
jgi:hypothetical protein